MLCWLVPQELVSRAVRWSLIGVNAAPKRDGDDSGEDLPTQLDVSPRYGEPTPRSNGTVGIFKEAGFISLFVRQGPLYSPVRGVRHRMLILSRLTPSGQHRAADA